MTTTVQNQPTTPTHRRDFLAVLKSYGLVWVLLGLCAIATWLSPSFLGVMNLVNVLRQIALLGIVGIGMTFVILARGIDLSVGSIVGLIAVVTALMLTQGYPVYLCVLAAIALGLVLGAINGLGIAIGRLPAFIMTLGSMVMFRGMALSIANGQPINVGDAPGFDFIGSGDFLQIPVVVWLFAAIALLAFLVLRYTSFGRYVYAVGSNTEAAHLAGINTRVISFIVYVISGLAAAITAIVYVSRLTVGEPTAGTGLELEAIAVTVIGGTSLFGGEGGVMGTVLGAAIIAVLANVMNLLGISPFTQQIIKGAIIIVAVLFEMYRGKGKKA
ncbi:ABC transporter permease [Paraburkholderia sabiae]|uniref:ABC transporter permease n=1 Tax=Paraburkholderia sabiae TaxID=273251 RepID=A0ABU9QI12_9BURK|nr:ABC transporter permease [Paraburkholderia sabiae]WJZ77424.1 ABC transporter permease [Paraburkholderia sabiae]CAD6557768.1 Ribose import permease protein RbsC [Paraburkholderia sabiae]